jgi:hypothetical protein
MARKGKIRKGTTTNNTKGGAKGRTRGGEGSGEEVLRLQGNDRTHRARARGGLTAKVTRQELDEAIAWIAAGKTLAEWARQPGRPCRETIHHRVRASPELWERYLAARETGHDAIAEDTLRIADEEVGIDEQGRTDSGAVAKQRLQVETRLKLLAKWDRRYSDRVELAGDPSAPLVAMSDQQVLQEVLGLLAVAKGRQLRGEKPRLGVTERNGHA